MVIVMYGYNLQRLLGDKRKILIILFLLLLPSIEVIQYIYEKNAFGVELPYPLYATFLSCYARGHIFHSIYFWILPIYILILTIETCVEDYTTGNKNIIMSRIGKEKYSVMRICEGFLVPFFIVLLGLLLNMVFVMIVCRGGTATIYGNHPLFFNKDTMPDTLLFKISYEHPMITNIIYALFTALYAGIIGISATVMSFVIYDRRVIYGINFVVWFIQIMFKNSILLLFQPFIEYGFAVIVPLFLWSLGVYLMIIMFFWMGEKIFVEV